jgi:hypothetical protein
VGSLRTLRSQKDRIVPDLSFGVLERIKREVLFSFVGLPRHQYGFEWSLSFDSLHYMGINPALLIKDMDEWSRVRGYTLRVFERGGCLGLQFRN